MANRIEQIINEMEEFIDSCKTQTFSSSNIIVNKDEIEELLAELKANTPDEIKRYQKIINNQEAILADAKAKAEAIIAEAQIQTNELISEHQIMQQAYAQANEVVLAATNQAQQILDDATSDANDIRTAAIAYTDDMLRNIEIVIKQTLEMSKSRQDAFAMNLTDICTIVTSNRAELHPEEEAPAEETPAPAPARGQAAPAPEKKDGGKGDFKVDIPIEVK